MKTTRISADRVRIRSRALNVFFKIFSSTWERPLAWAVPMNRKTHWKRHWAAKKHKMRKNSERLDSPPPLLLLRLFAAIPHPIQPALIGFDSLGLGRIPSPSAWEHAPSSLSSLQLPPSVTGEALTVARIGASLSGFEKFTLFGSDTTSPVRRQRVPSAFPIPGLFLPQDRFDRFDRSDSYPFPLSAVRSPVSQDHFDRLDCGSCCYADGATATVQGRFCVVHSLASTSPGLTEAGYSVRPCRASGGRPNSTKNGRNALIHFDCGSCRYADDAAAMVQGHCRVVHSPTSTSPGLTEAGYSVRPCWASGGRPNSAKNGRIALIWLDCGSCRHADGAAKPAQGRCRVVHSPGASESRSPCWTPFHPLTLSPSPLRPLRLTAVLCD
jgi:hypothetical protein